MSAGPLAGLRVLELGGIGPGPHAAMVLGDLGADVVRVDRPGGEAQGAADATRDHVLRNRRSVVADLKDADDLARVLALAEGADVLLESLRPGVAERLGIGPEECLRRHPGLVYTRLTGWGQSGPLADRAGHDLTYVAVTGLLAAIGRPDRPPTVPLNLLGDYGGGSMLAVVGTLAALLERQRSGRGQVVDAAMVDGAALLGQAFWSRRARGDWVPERGGNVVDGGAPFYDVYPCADGEHVAVAPLEPRFFAVLLGGLGLDPATLPDQHDRDGWPALRAAIGGALLTRTRAEWAEAFAGSDACLAPVLEFGEAATHPHLRERGTLTEVAGVVQAAPAPRFSRTPAATPRPPRPLGADTDAVLGGGGW